MDWSGCRYVERVPDRMSGAWVVKNSRVKPESVVESTCDGFSPEEITTELFIGLTIEQVHGVLAYAVAHEAHPV